jgi:hypothetical protein
VFCVERLMRELLLHYPISQGRYLDGLGLARELSLLSRE